MGTAFEPDGSGLRVGIWGTDCDYETSANALSGDGYWEFKATTPAADPELEYDEFIPVSELSPYSNHAWVYASAVAVGLDTVRIATEWHDNTKSIIGAAVDNFNAELPVINTWYHMGSVIDSPANARYAKTFVSKANRAFTVRLDRFDFKKMPYAFAAKGNAAQAIAHNTVTRLNFTTEEYDHGSIYVDPTFTSKSDGLYIISANTPLNPAVAYNGSTAYLYLFLNGGGGGGGTTYTVDKQILAAGGAYTMLQCSLHMKLARGDALDLYAFHLDNQNLFTVNGVDTRFSVARIE